MYLIFVFIESEGLKVKSIIIDQIFSLWSLRDLECLNICVGEIINSVTREHQTYVILLLIFVLNYSITL